MIECEISDDKSAAYWVVDQVRGYVGGEILGVCFEYCKLFVVFLTQIDIIMSYALDK